MPVPVAVTIPAAVPMGRTVTENVPLAVTLVAGGPRGGTGPTGPASIVPGPPGPTGPGSTTPGPTGPAGPPGTGVATYVWNQIVASAVWTIPHGMGNYPSVYTEDSAGSEIIGDVGYPDTNTVIVTFSTAEGGKAFLN